MIVIIFPKLSILIILSIIIILSNLPELIHIHHKIKYNIILSEIVWIKQQSIKIICCRKVALITNRNLLTISQKWTKLNNNNQFELVNKDIIISDKLLIIYDILFILNL